MNALSALLYVEFAQLRHMTENIFKKPGRTVLWGLWLAAIIGPQFVSSSSYRRGLTHAPEPLATIIALAAFTLLCFSTVHQARMGFVAFTSHADARFLIASHISPRIVGLWLQFRRIAYDLGRGLIIIVFYVLVWNRHHRSAGLLLTTFAYFSLIATTAIPMLSLRRRSISRLVSALLYALIIISLCGIAVLSLAAWSHGVPQRTAQNIVALGLGATLNRMLAGGASYLIVAWGAVIAMCALGYMCTADLYPELYDVSISALHRLQRLKRGLFSRDNLSGNRDSRTIRKPTAVPASFFSGAVANFWKEWLYFQRASNWRFTLIMWGFIWIFCGTAPFFLASTQALDNGFIVVPVSIILNMALLFAAISSVSLADDLRKPLWWLSSASLAQRLRVWLCAGAWRLAAGLMLGLSSAGIAAHKYWLVLAAIPIAVVFALYVKTIGLATYALFPSKIDARGPIAFLRFLLTYIALLPAAAGSLVGIPFHSILIGTSVSLLCMLAEMFGLVAFAGWRIAGAGLSFAQEEAA